MQMHACMFMFTAQCVHVFVALYLMHFCTEYQSILLFFRLWGSACLLVYMQLTCIFPSLEVVVFICERGHLDVWRQLVNHQRSLTHCPTSRGQRLECSIPFVFVHLCLQVQFVGCRFSFLFLFLCDYLNQLHVYSMLYTCVFMQCLRYMYTCMFSC